MNTKETALALAEFNSWRRGDETLEMPEPAELGATIDDAVNLLRRCADMERELEKTERLRFGADAERRQLRVELAAERARLDWLEKRRIALNAHCGSTYGWEVVQSHLVNRLMLRTPETCAMAGVDLNDSAVGGKDIRAAIDAAMKECAP